MPYAEVDLIEKDGVRVPDLPEGTEEFAVIDHVSQDRVLVETPNKVASYKTRKAVAKKPEHARGGINVEDTDPEFMSRGLSREEKAEQAKLGRPLKAAERAAVREKTEKVPGRTPPLKKAQPTEPAPPKKAAPR